MRRSRRGSVLIELALSMIVIVLLTSGGFQFGHAYSVYADLQRAVRNGARYASREEYPNRTAACLDKAKQRIRNLVVYGEPDASAKSRPAIPGLQAEHVAVDYQTDPKGVPLMVQVAIRGYSLESVFSTYRLNGTPSAAARFAGRYAPNGCLP
ncbi:MAG: TadE/TadG family type IV pilus assembly protein [Bryobacteraceae bacterium]